MLQRIAVENMLAVARFRDREAAAVGRGLADSDGGSDSCGNRSASFAAAEYIPRDGGRPVRGDLIPLLSPYVPLLPPVGEDAVEEPSAPPTA